MSELDRSTAREMETAAAIDLRGLTVAPRAPGREVLAMLARRGFHVSLARMDLPFDLESLRAEDEARIADALHHYAVRLFLRGAMKRPEGFDPSEATKFLTPEHARQVAELLVSVGLLTLDAQGVAKLVVPVRSFGATLEWYVAHHLERQLGFSVACGVKFHAPGVGGDLDVVAAAEGKLVYFELKSSPPKHLNPPEVNAFFDRVACLRPHLSLFAVDTALRLGDRVIPLLTEVLSQRGGRTPTLRCVERDLWVFNERIFLVNARPDLMGNLHRAIAEGFRALSPEL